MAIKGSRSGLYWRTIPGGLPAIVDLTKIAGDIYFVDSTKSTASDATGSGYHPDKPFATLDYAIGQCTANQGDHILVMPGHVETVIAAGGLDPDVAGITIVFAGYGNARGRISFGTDVGASMTVDAADITMINPRFVAAIDALTGPIDVNAARFKIIDGTWEDGTTINTTDCIVADANADDMVIDGFTFLDGDAGGTQKQSFIQIAAATRPVLRRIRATGNFGTGVIENGTAWVDALLEDIVIDNAAAGPAVVGILLQATSSGTARKVHVRVSSGTAYVTADNDMQWFESYGVGTDAAAGDHIGDVPSASIEGKVDSVGTQAGSVGTQVGSVGTQAGSVGTQAGSVGTLTTSVGTQATSIGTQVGSVGTLTTSVGTQATSIGTQVGSVGTQVGSVGTLVDSVGTQAGSVGTQTGSVGTLVAALTGGAVFKATIADGTTIPNNSQAAAGLLATATGGDILIEEIIWQRGATAFTLATNYEFTTNNVNGLTGAAGPNVVAVSAKFAANVTSIASLDGSTKQLPFVLESTKALYIHGGDNTTGAGGTTDFYIKYRPLTAGASLA